MDLIILHFAPTYEWNIAEAVHIVITHKLNHSINDNNILLLNHYVYRNFNLFIQYIDNYYLYLYLFYFIHHIGNCMFMYV